MDRARDWQIGRIVRNQRWRSGVPLGGLGCGKLELLTDGAFGNFTCNHNWDRWLGFVRGTFFALRDGTSLTLLRAPRHGEYDRIPGQDHVCNVAHVESVGLFPRARVRYGGLGATLELEAFSPLIPHNIADSALPVAFFTFRLTAAQRKTVTLLFSWEDVLGLGGRQRIAWDDRSGNHHEPLQLNAPDGATWSGLRFLPGPNKPEHVTGQHLVLSDGPSTIEPHWDPLAGLLAREVTLEPGRETTIRFAVVWFMPHYTVSFDKRRKLADQFNDVDAGAVLSADLQQKFTTNMPTIPGEQLMLDLGAPRSLDTVAVKTTWPQGDFTRTWTLDSSLDGQTWQPVPHTRERPRAGTAIFSFTPRAARYYCVNQTGWGTDWRWEVAHAVGRLGADEVPFTAARARVHAEELVHSSEDLGHYYLNAHPTADALAAYAVANIDRLYAETCAWQDLILSAAWPDWLKLKLINHAFPAVTGTLLTRDGRFSVMESPYTMDGALGTMDQRMAAHGFWLMLFPELDRRELELYAVVQDRVEPIADGRIPHFCGNFHNAVGDPNVDYGSTDWPDLSCSWIMQVLKHARWTGDRALLERTWPNVQRAMAWLAAQDHDGDLIPEGGSTYDYEHLPRGAYIFTASVYLGVLRAAAAHARTLGLASPYDDLHARVCAATIDRLYDRARGVFIKWTGGDQRVENTFVAPLAGDWMMQLTGLPGIFPPDITASVLRETLARHAKSFHPVPPMEVTPDGRVHTPICFILQHEPYLGCEAIYHGYVADGLDVVRRVYEAAWEVNWSPWDCPLNIEAPHGRQSWLATYMTATATWHVPPALAGTTIDLLSGTLHFTPRTTYHGPLFFPTFWAWLDCEEGRAQMRILRTFTPPTGAAPITAFTRVIGPAGEAPCNLPLAAGAVWDLSAFAHLPAEQSAPVHFPHAQPQPRFKPWSVRSSLEERYDAPPLRTLWAIDGLPNTCWTTDRAMQPGDWFQVDLGHQQPLAGITLDHAFAPGEYPRGLRVEVAADERSWQTVAELSEDDVRTRLDGGRLTIRFSAYPRLIRLTQLGRTPYDRWSIYEFDILPPDPHAGATPLPRLC